MFDKKKILLVCSPYYKEITSNLIKGASDLLKSKSVDYKILNVPGALEIAPAIISSIMENPFLIGSFKFII